VPLEVRGLSDTPTTGSSFIKTFDSPRKTLGALDADEASSVIAAASDIALVLDRDGVIRDLAFGSEELSREDYGKWLGQPWVDTVTAESRAKVDAVLRDVASKVPVRWRHVSHPSSRGADIPVAYSAVQVGSEGRVVAVGRDLRSLAALQQRLVEAQQSMERDYWRLRHVETRYRLLLQMAKEAVLIVDATTLKVVEANPAAAELLGEGDRRIVGRALVEGFDAASDKALQALLASVRVAGRADDIRVRLREGDRQFVVSASPFRHENATQFLVRLAPLPAHATAADMPRSSAALIAQVIDGAPDSFVVTDPEGKILAANASFMELAQLASEEQARGASLERWLGRPGVDLNVMIANLREYGTLRLFATTLRGEHGANADVEISAVAVPRGEPPCLGFTIRNVDRRFRVDAPAGRALPRSVEQLTELVGRVPLKDLVRDATDLIERLCMETALELTRNNRASAAEMLGLSRQSLYVKLRRYGLGNLGDNDE
jgi:transcriptional regulator PpsR